LPDSSTFTRLATLVPDWRRTRWVSGFLAITVDPEGGVSISKSAAQTSPLVGIITIPRIKNSS